MHLIYALVDPRTDEIRYIGVTKSTLRARFLSHCHEARHRCKYPVHRWIKKLADAGLEPQSRVLEETDDREREIYWIAQVRQSGGRLLNCTEGGQGTARPTAEVREAMGRGMRGKKLSPEAIARGIASRSWWRPSPEQIEKTRQALKGRKYPPEFGRAISERLKGRAISEEAKAKMSAAKKGKLRGPRDPAVIAKIKATSTGKSRQPLSQEHKVKIAAAIRGHQHTEESRAKMRKPKSAATRARMSQAQRGRTPAPFTDEHCRNLSKALRGKPKSPEHAAKVADAQRGKKRGALPEETKAKIARALEGRSHPWATVPWTPERRKNTVAMLRAKPPRATITEDRVRQMRALYQIGNRTQKSLADEFGVSAQTANAILKRRTWAWID